MSLCQSIDTLSMAFLDDELAVEDRREVELHLLDCASCRQHVDTERADLETLRKALVAPPAPMLLKARIAKALDAEDAVIARHERRRWSQWLLPGSAMFAAAAAVLAFFSMSVQGPPPVDSGISRVVARSKALPLEVQGASTGPWLRDHARIDPPQFTDSNIELLGGRLLPNGVAGHDAALLSYLVSLGQNRVTLSAVVVKGMHSDDFGDVLGTYRLGNMTLRLHNANGMPAVSYFDPRADLAYVFASERLTAEELMNLVATTDLVARPPTR